MFSFPRLVLGLIVLMLLAPALPTIATATDPPERPLLGGMPYDESVKLAWWPTYDGTHPLNLSTDVTGAHQAMLDDITSYNIYRGSAPGTATFLTSVVANPTQVVQFHDDTNLVNNVTYYYQVTAVNSVGESPRSNELVMMPVEERPPWYSPSVLIDQLLPGGVPNVQVYFDHLSSCVVTTGVGTASVTCDPPGVWSCRYHTIVAFAATGTATGTTRCGGGPTVTVTSSGAVPAYGGALGTYGFPYTCEADFGYTGIGSVDCYPPDP